jgi:DNA repair protein RadC
VGSHTAILLNLIPSLGAKYLRSRSAAEPDDIIDTAVAARRVLAPYFFGARNEEIYLLCLDAKLKLLGVRKVSEGTVTVSEIVTRKVLEHALSLNAAGVILAHNHPSGIAMPSDADKLATRHLKALLAEVDIQLRDHLIFVDDDMVSLEESGLLREL